MKSPIEIMLRNAICLQAAHVEDHDLMVFDYSTSPHQAKAIILNDTVRGIAEPDDWGVPQNLLEYGSGGTIASLYSNIIIARYRVDFVFELGDAPLLVVECDGHDYHDRTKQQASADRARDRALLRLGVSTIRFTGSDIHHDADACAVEVIEIARVLGGRSYFAGCQEGWSRGRLQADEALKHERAFNANRGIFSGILGSLG